MRKILFILAIFISTNSFAQLTIDLSTIKTQDKATAINFGLSYIKSVSADLANKELFVKGKSSIFTFNPQFDIQYGTQDAFNSLQAKLVGTLLSFKTTKFEGYNSPDFTKNINVFPIAIGVETNSSFTSFNGIIEAGYEPFYQGELSNAGEFLKHTTFGIWVQGGYKFQGASTSTPITGGAKDESSEMINSSILRLKSSASIDSKAIVKIQGLSVGLVGSGDVWYDAINSRIYHRIKGTARVYLSNGTYIDLDYSKGAGAPTFNDGTQVGAGVKIQF